MTGPSNVDPPTSAIRKGVALVMVASIGFGLNPLFARLAYADGLTPQSTLLFRFLIAALALLPLTRILAADRKDLIATASLGAIIAVGSLAFFRALAVLPIAPAVLIFFTYPLFTVALGATFFGVDLSRRSLAGATLIFFACALIVSPRGLSAEQWHALILCFITPVCHAFYLLGAARWLKDIDPQTRAAGVAWGGVLVLLPAAYATDGGIAMPASIAGWSAVLWLGLISSAGAMALFLWGITLAGAARTAIAGGSELITSLLIGWLVYAEEVTLRAIVGAALILVAIRITVPRRGQVHL